MNKEIEIKEIIYEHIIYLGTIREMENFGLTRAGIVAFADDIMDRYFSPEYLFKDPKEYNEEGDEAYDPEG